jgi:hypothetical protein
MARARLEVSHRQRWRRFSQGIWRFDFVTQPFFLDLSLGLQPKLFAVPTRPACLFLKLMSAFLYFEIVAVRHPSSP